MKISRTRKILNSSFYERNESCLIPHHLNKKSVRKSLIKLRFSAHQFEWGFGGVGDFYDNFQGFFNNLTINPQSVNLSLNH
jgi:hypothetical protein